MKSWSEWFASRATERRSRARLPQGIYMAEDGPITAWEAIDRYGVQCLQSPFFRLGGSVAK